jgi:hypothetical protein
MLSNLLQNESRKRDGGYSLTPKSKRKKEEKNKRRISM